MENTEKIKILKEVVSMLNKAKFDVSTAEMVVFANILRSFSEVVKEMEKENAAK